MEVKGLLNKILDKQDEIKADITEIKIVQAEQKIVLDEHMKRSLSNEEAVNILKSEILPIQKHVDSVSTILKFIGAIGATITVVAGFIKILSFFN